VSADAVGQAREVECHSDTIPDVDQRSQWTQRKRTEMPLIVLGIAPARLPSARILGRVISVADQLSGTTCRCPDYCVNLSGIEALPNNGPHQEVPRQ
jgi:hypothetical protein